MTTGATIAPLFAAAASALLAFAPAQEKRDEPPRPKKAEPAAAQTPAPSPSGGAVAAEAELDKFLAAKGVRLDRAAAAIRVDGVVNMQKGLIEVFATTPAGKTHEAVVALECVPSALNAAFLALGYKPGKPVEYGVERYVMPEGEPVWITVEWTTEAGATKRVRAEDLVYDRSTEKALEPMAWIYIGSQMQPGPDPSRPLFAADAIKSLVTTYHDPTTIVENPMKTGDDDTLFFANEAATPPPRTPVTVTFWRKEPPRSPSSSD